MQRAIVYDTDTGEIGRHLQGNIDRGRIVLDEGEALLTDEEARFPDSLRGKIVDTTADPPEIIDDPDFAPPRTKAGILEDLRDGTITEREALEDLLSL